MALIDNQTIIRMNRATLYSSIAIDISEGVTLTMLAIAISKICWLSEELMSITKRSDYGAINLGRKLL